jgi:hypothetical protein
MSQFEELVRLLNDINRQVQAVEYNHIIIGPYADKPLIVRQLIDENADRMRPQFKEQGYDFDAWRAGAENFRLD